MGIVGEGVGVIEVECIFVGEIGNEDVVDFVEEEELVGVECGVENFGYGGLGGLYVFVFEVWDIYVVLVVVVVELVVGVEICVVGGVYCGECGEEEFDVVDLEWDVVFVGNFFLLGDVEGIEVGVKVEV